MPTQSGDLLSPPSDQLDPRYKNADWYQKWAEFIEKLYNSQYNQKRRELAQYYRQLARGEQRVQDYYHMLNISDEDIANKESWFKSDWITLKLDKFWNIVADKLAEAKKGLIIKQIDYNSYLRRRDLEAQIEDFVNNQDLYKTLEGMGIETQSPLPEGVPVPNGKDELQLFMDTALQPKVIHQMHEAIDETLQVNRFNDIYRECMNDILRIGYGGTMSYMGRNRATINRCIPENFALLDSDFSDYRDLPYIGYRRKVTLGELRNWDTNNELTEEDYYQIANSIDSSKYSNTTSGTRHAHYNTTGEYPYDREAVYLWHAEWFSDDLMVTKSRKNKVGNKVVETKAASWYKPQLAHEDFVEQYAKQGQAVHAEPYKNIYNCYWIEGTKYKFRMGMQQSQERNREDYSDPKFSYRVVKVEKSLLEVLEPRIHMANVHWFQYKHYSTQSKGDGTIMDPTKGVIAALGQGEEGEEADPIKAILMNHKMLTQLGVGFGELTAQGFAMQEFKGGMAKAALDHFQMMQNELLMTAEDSGFNSVTDASSPDAELTNQLAQFAFDSHSHAIGPYRFAGKRLHEETAIRLSFLIPEMLRANSDLSPVEKSQGKLYDAFAKYVFDVRIESGLEEAERQRLHEIIIKEMDAQALASDVGLMILNQDNLQKAMYHYILAKKQRKEEEREMAAQNAQMNNEGAAQAAQLASEAKLKEIELEGQWKVKVKEIDLAIEDKKLERERILQLTKHDHEEELQEEQHDHEQEMQQAQTVTEITKESMRVQSSRQNATDANRSSKKEVKETS